MATSQPLPSPPIPETQPGSAIADAEDRYSNLLELQERQANAGPTASGLFDGPIAAASLLLNKLCEDPEVTSALQSELDAMANQAAQVTVLEADDHVPTELLTEARAMLEARQQTPRARLAAHYFGSLAVDATAAKPTSKDNRNKPGSKQTRKTNSESLRAAEALLLQDELTLAQKLQGMQLQIGDEGEPVTITAVRPQDRQFNSHYLPTRPLFGENRQQVYIGATNGRYILMLAAGSAETADACVTVMGVRIGDETISLPSKVAYALGLRTEMVGTVRLNGNVLTLDLEPRKTISNRDM